MKKHLTFHKIEYEKKYALSWIGSSICNGPLVYLECLITLGKCANYLSSVSNAFFI